MIHLTINLQEVFQTQFSRFSEKLLTFLIKKVLIKSLLIGVEKMFPPPPPSRHTHVSHGPLHILPITWMKPNFSSWSKQ